MYFVEKPNKIALLVHLLKQEEITRALVFTRTKHGADKVVRHLAHAKIMAVAIHGNKSQHQREHSLSDFKRGHARVLVATDIASRGLDIDDISHVINFDLPFEPEAYVHRIGRTGRAGALGAAFSFCSSDERPLLKDIESLIRMHITVATDQPYHVELALKPPVQTSRTPQAGKQPRRMPRQNRHKPRQ